MSDTHIGACGSDHLAILEFLKRLNADELIFNGDLFDLWSVSAKRIRERHGDILDAIKDLHGRGTALTYVIGNHDASYMHDPVLPDLVPVNGTTIARDGRRTAIVHGHQYDGLLRRITSWPMFRLNEAWCRMVGREIWVTSKRMARGLKERTRHAFGRRNYDSVVTGHVHVPEHDRHGDVEYLNCGDWRRNDTYVKLEDGRFELLRFK